MTSFLDGWLLFGRKFLQELYSKVETIGSIHKILRWFGDEGVSWIIKGAVNK